MTSRTSSFPLSASLGLWISITTICRLLFDRLAIGAISTYTGFLFRIGTKLFGVFLGKVGLTGGHRPEHNLSETFPEFGKTILLKSKLIKFRHFPDVLISFTPPVEVSYCRPKAEIAIG